MAKIHWFEQEEEGDWEGYVFPKFKIYEGLDHNLRLFIMDSRPQSIRIDSVQEGKVKAAKHLKERSTKND